MKNEKLTANPFRFGDPVEGEYYLPRPDLSNLIRQFLENRVHIVLMGPRRFGKTSFVLNLLEQLQKEGYSCLFVDIFNITSYRDFLHQLLRAIRVRKSFSVTLRSWWDKTKRFCPQVSADFIP
ncbi:MAG: ATP-binding protein [Candidatus Protochlamydia sp.]|nr:ATP-binding protein [Candidatus Protochlamydia sp.]